MRIACLWSGPISERTGSTSLAWSSIFAQIKRVISGWIDANLDHCMLLHRDDPILPILQKQGEPVFVLDVNPTAENIARLIYDHAVAQGFPVVEVKLWETDDCFAVYRGNNG